MSKAAELRYVPKEKKLFLPLLSTLAMPLNCYFRLVFVLFNNDENNSEQCYYLSNNYVLIMSLVCQR